MQKWEYATVPAAGPRDQADPRQLGRGRLGARRRASPAPTRSSCRLPEAARRREVTVSDGPHARLAELGLDPARGGAAGGRYVPAVQSGQHVYVSGQLPMVDGKLLATGKVGAEVSAEQAKELAAAVRAQRARRRRRAGRPGERGQDRQGDRVRRVRAGLHRPAGVINGASELFGDGLRRGRPARPQRGRGGRAAARRPGRGRGDRRGRLTAPPLAHELGRTARSESRERARILGRVARSWGVAGGVVRSQP